MKYLRIIGVVFAAFLFCSSFTLKKGKNKSVYVFGIAASFNDTIVYYTDIQLLDSVSLDKNGFLPERELYAYQLKNHVEYDLKKSNYTCMIYFSKNKVKLGKEAGKIRSKYQKTDGIVLRAIEPSNFKFKKVEENY